MANNRREQQTGTPILRLRNDLEVFPHSHRRRRIWVVKDPVALRYFHFNEEEFAILNWLDGRQSLEQIKANFDTRFAPLQLPLAQLHFFIVQLHRQGLATSTAVGQGLPLLERHARHRRSERWSALSNPLAIRFRGFDPERLLNGLMPYVRWLFSPWLLAGCLLLIAVSLLLVVANFDEFRSRLPQLDQLIAPANLLYLAIALALTKLLHEFGHALTCKYFGGECHEMGVMLLMFTPCLYCNVTDAWTFASRRKRLAVSGAGIFVELVLAAICTLLWWSSKPGLLQALSLNVMLVCSVGTVLLNGNPLLRYDGYYLLSDFLSLPNLWQDSRDCFRRWLGWFFWGTDFGRPTRLHFEQPALLLTYAVASLTYRSFVLVSILYLLYRLLEPLGLVFLVQLLTVLVLVGIVTPLLRSLWETLGNPMLRRYIHPQRVFISGCFLALVIAAVLFLPLPCRLSAPATIQPLDAKRVYVSVPGILQEAVRAGDAVAAGDVLAHLENIGLVRELKQVEGEVLAQRIRVRSLESLRGQQAEFAAQLPAAQEMLSDLEHRQQQLAHDLEALRIVAPVAGIVLPPPRTEETESSDSLPHWSGTPLDENNRGCTLERRTLLCLIGRPDAYEAVLKLDQSSVAYVQAQQPVRLRLEVAPGTFVSGHITEIAREATPLANPSNGISESPGQTSPATGPSEESERQYLAHVKLEPTEVALLTGMTGQARIRLAPQTLSTRLQRLLARNFKPLF